MDYKKYFENDIKSIPFSDVIDKEAFYLEYRETDVFPDINIFLSKAFENISENLINDEIVLQKEAEFLALMKDKSKAGKLKLLEYSKPSIATTKTFKALVQIQEAYDFILDLIVKDEDYENDKLTLIHLIRSILSPYNQQAVLKAIIDDNSIATRIKLGEFDNSMSKLEAVRFDGLKNRTKKDDLDFTKKSFEKLKRDLRMLIPIEINNLEKPHRVELDERVLKFFYNAELPAKIFTEWKLFFGKKHALTHFSFLFWKMVDDNFIEDENGKERPRKTHRNYIDFVNEIFDEDVINRNQLKRPNEPGLMDNNIRIIKYKEVKDSFI
ncbi:hypothetical protein G6R40_01170 [Chryseobacterium sp. POL2]|uniref:hypothetical protein n=1 Tax=Chryseobacterium sp. POL2 TaxID=2713414 RepID=UPI0013E0FEAA|nr:hypothetical protein [Chryseobacterium sp. POL2]QIG88349.1 hypothetical protein G6R40_01170 [Chryseobacterium sp. POL2]